MKYLSRRSFLAGAFTAGVALAGWGLAGCSAAQTGSASASASASGALAASSGSAATSGASSEPAAASSAASSMNAASAGASSEASVAAEATSAGPAFNLAKRTVLLNNGIEMPVLGLGTFILSNAQAEESVYAALMAGTRLIDTARIYGNESGVGRGIARAGVPRDEVFLTTKLWTDDFSNAAAAIDASLQNLGQDYVDLMLLHHEHAHDEEAYHAMEDAVAAGKIRAIGISNFYEDGIARMAQAANIAPAVLQNETHPYYQERGPKAAAAESGTVLESWFPLGGKQDCHTLFADPTIAQVAANHGITPAQAIIRWHLQSGNICIPGSSNPDHIQEDAHVWSFELADDEMAAINALEQGKRLAWY